MTSTDQQLTPAEIRLAQYGQRTSTWSTATYDNGTEKALHEIALGLKEEVDRLRAELADQRAYEQRLREQHDTDVAEVRRLRARLADEERQHGQTIDDRDRFHEMADKLAYAIAPEGVIGEHSSMNCPWENALDLITPAAEVDKLRARVAELEEAGTYARSALAALCYDLEDPGSNALGALYELSRATSGVEAPRDDAALALAKHAAEVLENTADLADPEPPEASFFGDYGTQVADWLRRRANDAVRNTTAPAARSAAV